MLVIRMQRTGRKGHAQFRIVVQDSRRTPTSGKLVAQLGHYDPHSKQTVINKEKTSFYLDHGAQPSERVVRLLKSEGIKLPSWVKAEPKKKGSIRNVEKLRRNRPAEEKPSEPKEPVAEEPAPDVTQESPAEAEVEAEGQAATESEAETEPEASATEESSENNADTAMAEEVSAPAEDSSKTA